MGGSTRIPRIKQLVQEYFGEKEVCQSIDPDSVLAHGAASQVDLSILDISFPSPNKHDLMADFAQYVYIFHLSRHLCFKGGKSNSMMS